MNYIYEFEQGRCCLPNCSKSLSVNSDCEWCNATLQLEPSWDHELISYKMTISWKYLFVVSNLPKNLPVNFLLNMAKRLGQLLLAEHLLGQNHSDDRAAASIYPKIHLKLIVEWASKNTVQMWRCATHLNVSFPYCASLQLEKRAEEVRW